MIEFLEIRDSTRKLVGIIDDAKSIIWVSEYYGAGTFEIYTPLTDQARELLQIGNFVTRSGEKNAAIIEAVDYTDNVQEGIMIIARGRMLKSILDRRLAYQLTGNTITPVKMSGDLAAAVQGVVRTQAGADAPTARKLGVTIGSTGGINKTITTADEGEEESSRQSSYKNLLEFTDTVLQEYECGALMRIDADTKEIIYDLFEGADRSVGNTAGNLPVIFSQDFENLLSVNYTIDTTAKKTWALIGGEGQGLDRFFTTYDQDSTAGLERREVFVDASSIPRKYDDEGTERQYTAAEYTALLVGQAQTDLKELIITKTFEAEINLTQSSYKYGVDFWLGDIVTVQDNALGLFANVRIISATEAQDENGYILSVAYGN